LQKLFYHGYLFNDVAEDAQAVGEGVDADAERLQGLATLWI
jgi:hypothetical protein